MDGSRARATLGLSSDANEHDVKRAFRARAKAHHPDNGGCSDAFRLLQQAYEIALAESAVRCAPSPNTGRFLNAADLAWQASTRATTSSNRARCTGFPVKRRHRSFAQELRLAMSRS